MMTAENYLAWVDNQIKSNEKEIERLKNTISKIEGWNARLREGHKNISKQNIDWEAHTC